MLIDRLANNENYFYCVRRITDKLSLGELTTARANVELVIAARVKIISNSLPRDVRKALNDAVKTGELGRFKSDGLKPECYYYNKPAFISMAKIARNQIEEKSKKALKAVFCINHS
jgi:hypothetical protein